MLNWRSVWVCALLMVFSSPLMSTTLKELDVIDSAGQPRNSTNYKIVFQSVGSITAPMTTKGSHKVVHGPHVSAKVHDIAGYNLPYDTEDVSLSATGSGLVRSRIQFQTKKSDASLINFSTQFDASQTDGWASIWDSTVQLDNTHETVSFRARFFDGLTWGSWFETADKSIIDNLAPVISNTASSEAYMSPDNVSSEGIQDTSSLTFDMTEPYLKSWKINIKDSNNDTIRLFDHANLTDRSVAVQWDGKNTAGDFVDDGTYSVHIDVIDQVDHLTQSTTSLIIDNTSPSLSLFNLTATGKALNSGLGDLDASWTSSDALDDTLDFQLKLGVLDPDIKSITKLVLWLDAAEQRTIEKNGSNVLKWLDKSANGNDFNILDATTYPSYQANNLAGYGTIQFDVGTLEGLKSSTSVSAGTYYVYVISHDGTSWGLESLEEVLAVDRHVTVGNSEVEPLSEQLDVAEILVFNAPLTSQEDTQIQYYLNHKWQLSNANNFTLVSQSQTAKTWDKDDVDDGTYYQLQLKAKDNAGNNTVIVSNITQTPDRTAPVIDASFVSVTGTEDISWVEDPSNHKFDALTAPSLTTWEPSLILTSDDAVKSSEEILQAISAVESNLNLKFDLKQHVNTDPSVDAATDGNVFGKEQAWVTVKLKDAEGNYAEKEIQVHVTPVNDAPELITVIGENPQSDDYNIPIYHIKFNEDLTDTLILDTFIQDVDNLKSDLVWTLQDSEYYKTGTTTQTYHKETFKVKIGDDSTNHLLTLTPTSNWYGDETLTVAIQDPAGLNTTQNVIVRVWPINDPPIIKETLASAFTIDEDTNIVLDLTDYEDDVIYEDGPPTYNNLLKWSVAASSVDSSVIELINGNNSANDTLTFKPIDNKYGQTTVTLVLEDTDTVAETLFPPGTQRGGYTASPLTTTKSITLTWEPINDAPVIGSIPDQIENEDVGTWTLDLSALKTDVEDSGSKLKWAVTLPDDIAIFNYNDSSNIITFTSKSNAWGSSTITVALTDTDEDISFSGYTSQPITVQKDITLQLNPINDAPSLSSAALKSNETQDVTKALTTDTLRVDAVGYSDVGYQTDARQSSSLGDEYNTGRNGELSFTPNQKKYHYKWFADGVQIKYSQGITDSYDTLQITDAYEGQTITVEVSPDDGQLTGTVLTQTMTVNNRPAIVNSASLSPINNKYTNLQTVDVIWPISSDVDAGESIGYRIKIWKVAKWGSAPEDVSLTATSFYDSNWFYSAEASQIKEALASLEHGTYYWKVWSGNAIQTSFWDTREPSWLSYFHVDLIDPSITDITDVIQVSEIATQNAVIQDSGNIRILYGQKPTDADDNFEYKILLNWENTVITEGVPITTSGEKTIVSLTKDDAWTYVESYPEGTTTYNVILEDLALNRTPVNTFIVTEDLTPPVPFEINGAVITNFEAIASSNKYYISGIKEGDTALYYEGYNTLSEEIEIAQIVGFTLNSEFSFHIYPEKPSGNIYTEDRAGNRQALTTDVDITFLEGQPIIESTGLSRTLVNAKENESNLINFGLSVASVNELINISLPFSVDRQISNYSLKKADGTVVLSGTTITANTQKTLQFEISKSTFTEGDNTLTLTVADRAQNTANKNFTFTMKTEKPEENVIITAEISGQSAMRSLRLFGQNKDNISVLVNDEIAPVSSSAWYYIQNINPETTDVIVTFIDDVYNATAVKIWDKSHYSTYASNRDIPLPISELDGGAVASEVAVAYTSLPTTVKSILIVKNSPVARNSRVSSEVSFPAFIFQNQAFSMPYSLSEKSVSVVAKDDYGNVVDNCDLTDHHVIISIQYDSTTEFDEEDLRMVKFNDTTQEWEENTYNSILDRANNVVYAQISSTGLFALAEFNLYQSNLSTTRLYPNPWIPDDGDDNTGDLTGVIFDRLTEDSSISIYTIEGSLVMESTPQAVSWTWNGQNKTGDDVFSGVYLVVIRSEDETKTKKLTIIR